MKTLLLFFAGMASFVVFGQDGSLDTSFGDGGMVIEDIANSYDLGSNVTQQPDGKIIVTGNTSPDTNNYNPILIRYLTDGSLDNSFGSSGIVTSDFINGYYENMGLFVDNQNNILSAVSGYQGSSNVFLIARYLESGELDTTFGTNGIVSIAGRYNIVFKEDGSFILLRFTAANEITISSYLNTGLLDPSFGVNGFAVSNISEVNFGIDEVKINNDGTIFLVGTRDNNANADIILLKFQSNGYLDTNFGTNGVATKNIDALNWMNFSSSSIDFTNDNKIVVAGSCGACVDLFQPVLQPFFIKYLQDGMPDANFGNNGTVLLPISGFSISKLIIQKNQRMIVSGSYLDCFEGSIYSISRYFPGGTQDNSFIGGAGIDFDYRTSYMQDDGKILSVGNTFWYNGPEDIVLLRHNNNPLSISEFENQKITIYPNPSNGIFTVENNFYSEKEPYQITDITGKIIATGELNDKQTQINLFSAQSGVYFLKTTNSVFRLLKN